MLNKNPLAVFLLVTSFVFNPVYAEPINLTQEARSSRILTIYNDDLVMINDRYRAELPAGYSRLDFTAISPSILPASALLHALPRGMDVTSQYFQRALTPEDMLPGAVGQSVSLVSIHPQTGKHTVERARVLTSSNGPILEIDGRYETELAGRRIVYDSLPEGVLTPTLSIGIDSQQQAQADFTLSYLSTGLSWRADYSASLNEKQDTMHLLAMATLHNFSGMDYENAGIELVAGSVNQASQARRRGGVALQMAAMDSESVAAPRAAIGDLHVYSLPGQFDLAEASSRQLTLFSARDVTVEKRYRLTGDAGLYFSPVPGEQLMRAESYIEFDNLAAHKLGMPMPAGTVRVYAATADSADRLKFLGADDIGHTPEMARVSLKTGLAFDISATREQLAYRKLPVEQPHRQHSEVTVLTTIKNARQEAATVQLKEMFSGEWQIVNGPEPDVHDARSAIWDVAVPARGETELSLTVRVRR